MELVEEVILLLAHNLYGRTFTPLTRELSLSHMLNSRSIHIHDNAIT